MSALRSVGTGSCRPSRQRSSRCIALVAILCGAVLLSPASAQQLADPAAALASEPAVEPTVGAVAEPVAEPAPREAPPVVLLHGLGRSERAMWLIKRRFLDAGFAALAIGYDSRTQSIDEIVAEVDAELEACCAALEQIHFVTHSLGGIVLRAWAETQGSERIGRAVMLSPPNHGSAIVDRLGRLGAVLGPTGEELGAYDDSTPSRLNALGPVGFELGVIAGDRSLNPIGSWILDGPDDGTVSVESARVDGMRDFLVLPATHSFMMYDADVAKQALRFVETGAFSHASEDDPHAAQSAAAQGDLE